jgi:penicillin-binding protein 1A
VPRLTAAAIKDLWRTNAADSRDLASRVFVAIRSILGPNGRLRLWLACRRQPHRYVIATVVIMPVLVALLVVSWAAWELRDVQFPSPAEITSQRVIVLQTADGRQLADKGSYRLAPVAAKDMPAAVVNAVTSIEDRHFYQHGGVDLPSMLRAIKQNLDAGKVVAGGSTITQQLVKILFLTSERTYTRKIQEAAIAVWLELHLTKNQILTSYLNNVYLGSGATGFPAAAKLYFGKSVGDLSLPEAAMLAGMINAPSLDDPLLHLDAARSRAATVLDAMVVNGKLSQEDALAAKLNPAAPNPTEISPRSAGWFADWVSRQVAEAVPAPNGGAVTVRTTLDLRLQEMAEKIVQSTLAAYGRQKQATQAAPVAMRPDGAVVAMVGGRSYKESPFNRAVQAKRQPGSAFKLFDYYAALREGFTPDDEILDEPVEVNGWEPDNFGLHYHGPVTLADAFAHSLNAATVRTTQDFGIDKVIAAARDLGLRAPLGNNPSLALGTSEVTLPDLTSAYAAVRAGVAPVEPWGIAGVSTRDDQNYSPVGRPGEPQHRLGQYQNELIDLLQGVVEHGTGRAAALPGFAAGKTGTSQDYRDAWFVGFNDTLIVGVWVGNDDHSPMKGVVGGSLPAMIWKRFMEQAAPVTATIAEEPQATSALDRTAASPVAGVEGSQCNIPVCEQYYQSFRASDCTYQPFYGPRQYCNRQADIGRGTYSRRAQSPAGGPAPYGLFAPMVDARQRGWRPYD